MNTTATVGYNPSSNILKWDDATWLLQLSFVIFTMQTGFGLLETGCVRMKNEVNIMMKNAIDVIFGGISYWMFGYGTSYGEDRGSNSVFGVGYYFVSSPQNEEMGSLYTNFIYQLSFATTATTIVSGSMAERTKLSSYVIFSFLNTVIYCLPARWIWSKSGFLYKLGVIDIAGGGAVHLVGGVSGVVCASLLGARIGRWDRNLAAESNPTNSLVGLFMLWWGWLAFNGSSAMGISGGKWKVATKAVVNTLNSSIGGGLTGVFLTVIINNGKYDVGIVVNCVLAGLVGVTAGCAVFEPWESVIIGLLSGLIMTLADKLVVKMKIDDPVSATAVHCFGGMWSLLAVGIFCQEDKFENLTRGHIGLVHGGGFKLLGYQAIAIVSIMSYASTSTFVILGVIKVLYGIRLEPLAELEGADYSEHMTGSPEEYDEITLSQANKQFFKRRLSGILTKHNGEVVSVWHGLKHLCGKQVKKMEINTVDTLQNNFQMGDIENGTLPVNRSLSKSSMNIKRSSTFSRHRRSVDIRRRLNSIHLNSNNHNNNSNNSNNSHHNRVSESISSVFVIDNQS